MSRRRKRVKCRAEGCSTETSGIEHYCSKHRGLSINRRFTSLKHKAGRKGIELDISLYDYEVLLSSNSCHYCGGPLPKTGHGLDRVDSSKGYTKDNVVVCCYGCNTLKMDRFSYLQFKILIDFVQKMEQNNWVLPVSETLNNKEKK